MQADGDEGLEAWARRARADRPRCGHLQRTGANYLRTLCSSRTGRNLGSSGRCCRGRPGCTGPTTSLCARRAYIRTSGSVHRLRCPMGRALHSLAVLSRRSVSRWRVARLQRSWRRAGLRRGSPTRHRWCRGPGFQRTTPVRHQRMESGSRGRREFPHPS